MKIAGKVKWFDDQKGYGFIVGDDHKEYFLHYSQIEMEGHKTVEKGASVFFEESMSDKGLQALSVVAVNPEA